MPDRVDIKDVLRKNNSKAACMSGSGSAIYGIFTCAEDAKKAQKELLQKYSKVYLCNPQREGVKKI